MQLNGWQFMERPPWPTCLALTAGIYIQMCYMCSTWLSLLIAKLRFCFLQQIISEIAMLVLERFARNISSGLLRLAWILAIWQIRNCSVQKHCEHLRAYTHLSPKNFSRVQLPGWCPILCVAWHATLPFNLGLCWTSVYTDNSLSHHLKPKKTIFLWVSAVW